MGNQSTVPKEYLFRVHSNNEEFDPESLKKEAILLLWDLEMWTDGFRSDSTSLRINTEICASQANEAHHSPSPFYNGDGQDEDPLMHLN